MIMRAARSCRSGENRKLGFTALITTVFCFGTLWTSAKLSIDYLPPLWFTASRFAIGAAFVALVLALQGRLKFQTAQIYRSSYPSAALCWGFIRRFFNALKCMREGQRPLAIPPQFVTPIAVLFLGERLTRLKIFGLASAMFGFLLLFSPAELDWSDRDVLIGNGLLVVCVLLWSCVILHLRVHRQVTDTLALVPWYLVTSFMVAAVSGLIFEGPPAFEVTKAGWAILLYAGIVGSGIGNWGVTTAIMNLPATTSTIGLLGVPVFAMIISVAFLGETLTWPLLLGLVLIVCGIAAVTLSSGSNL